MDAKHENSIFSRSGMPTRKLPRIAAACLPRPVKKAENTRQSLAMCDICVNTHSIDI